MNYVTKETSMHVRSKYSWMKHLDFIIIDAILLNISLILAYVIRTGNFKTFPFSEYRAIAIIVTILHLCIVLFSSTYSDILYRGYFTEFKKVALHTLKLVAFSFILLFLMRNIGTKSRFILAVFPLIFLVLSYFAHIFWIF